MTMNITGVSIPSGPGHLWALSIGAFLGPEVTFCPQIPTLLGAYSLQNGIPLLPHPLLVTLIPVGFPSSFMILDNVSLTRTKFGQCSHPLNVIKSPLHHAQYSVGA